MLQYGRVVPSGLHRPAIWRNARGRLEREKLCRESVATWCPQGGETSAAWLCEVSGTRDPMTDGVWHIGVYQLLQDLPRPGASCRVVAACWRPVGLVWYCEEMSGQPNYSTGSDRAEVGLQPRAAPRLLGLRPALRCHCWECCHNSVTRTTGLGSPRY